MSQSGAAKVSLLAASLVGSIWIADAPGAEPAGVDLAKTELTEQALSVADDVSLNGNIPIMDVAEAYPQGVLYIDFRTAEEEGVALDRESALRLGMRYERIPVDGPQITNAAVQQLQVLLAERYRYQHTVLRCKLRESCSNDVGCNQDRRGGRVWIRS